MSLVSNLTVYLLSNYNLSSIYVVNVVQIWNGSSNIFSLIGAFISDTYLGRFKTLFFGSIASFLVRKITCIFPLFFYLHIPIFISDSCFNHQFLHSSYFFTLPVPKYSQIDVEIFILV
ncbi:hypothetical protein V8G54_016500 [Vigna mungo]|uniref:Uncharacterized protein n=1 Tax=Vigna mungo TaxID=3915 RepID=A0AAQ3NKC7_VIGMU